MLLKIFDFFHKKVDVFHFAFNWWTIFNELWSFQIKSRNIFFDNEKWNNDCEVVESEICFKFNEKQQIDSIVMIIIAKNSKKLLQNFIDVFDLIIDFEIIRWLSFQMCFNSLIQSFSKINDKFYFLIENNVFWKLFYSLYSIDNCLYYNVDVE